MESYDELDHKLIAILQKDGRAPLSKLAEILQISRSTVNARLNRLLRSGAVLGFTIRVRQQHVDGAIDAIMMIAMAAKSTASVIKQMRGMPELHTLHTTNGRWDLIAELRAASLHDFELLLRRVRSIEGVQYSETSILLTSI